MKSFITVCVVGILFLPLFIEEHSQVKGMAPPTSRPAQLGDWHTDFQIFSETFLELQIEKGEKVVWQGEFSGRTTEHDMWAFDGSVGNQGMAIEFREGRPDGVKVGPDTVKAGLVTVHIWLGCNKADLDKWNGYEPGDIVKFTGKTVWCLAVDTKIDAKGTWKFGFLAPQRVLRIDEVVPIGKVAHAARPSSKSPAGSPTLPPTTAPTGK